MKFLYAFLFCIFVYSGAQSQIVISDTMSLALQKLERMSKNGSPQEYANALCEVAALDLYASLDREAEEYAIQAEKVARKHNLKETLARVLIIKANVCAFAETDSLFNRNDEGLEYALEAVSLSDILSDEAVKMDALCSASQLYINKNRWNRNLNLEWYASADNYLKKAESIAKSIPALNSPKLVAYRVRYYRQGGYLRDAVEHCESSLEMCSEDDNLLKLQIYDQLVSLYMDLGEQDLSLSAHRSYVHYNLMYTRQRESEKLQDLQAKYELKLKHSQLKDKTYQILFLSAMLVLLIVLAMILAYKVKRERRFRNLAERDSNVKQELLEFISSDLNNPLNSGVGSIEQFLTNAVNMNGEEIAAEAQKLLEDEHNLSHSVAEYISDLVLNRRKRIDLFGLSAREMEIVRLSVEGLRSSAIAEKLNISTRTVNNHKANIYSKMGVNSNSEMCKFARENGLK